MRTYSEKRGGVLTPDAVEQLTREVVHGVVRPQPAHNAQSGLECLVQLRNDDARSGIQYRDCLIDYTSCPNSHCIKKLV